MDSAITIFLHYHGDFGPVANKNYIGGKVEVITKFDTGTFCFRDLEDFAIKYGYNP